MCENCDIQSAIADENATSYAEIADTHLTKKAPKNKRLKLWELNQELHCSIIGTCAPVSILRTIYEKLTRKSSDKLGDYQIHNMFVSAAGKPHDGIKMLHKYLEKRYKPLIREAKLLETERELGDFWNRCKEKGETAGGYWTIMTHPKVDERFDTQVFGEVHMMSHIAGQQWQAGTRKLKQVSQESSEYRQSLARKEKTIAELRRNASIHSDQINKLELELKRQTEFVAEQDQKINELLSNAALRAAESRIKSLEKQLHETKTGDEVQQDTFSSYVESNASTDGNDLLEAKQQIRLLEQRIKYLLCGRTEGPCTESCDLGGKCVLYVGGKSGSKANFRKLVEAMNGEFLYHDGGREDSRQQLPKLLGRADMVVCPTSCVSHTAAHRIKSECARHFKQVAWIKSPSLAAFNSALNELDRIQ